MFWMSCLLITCTGEAVSTSVRRMLEPVTSMRARSVALSLLSWAKAGTATDSSTPAMASDSGAIERQGAVVAGGQHRGSLLAGVQRNK